MLHLIVNTDNIGIFNFVIVYAHIIILCDIFIHIQYIHRHKYI